MSPDEIAGTRSRDDVVTLPPAMAPVANYVSAVRAGMIAVTFDHRVVDGARAAEFGLAVIRRLERS